MESFAVKRRGPLLFSLFLCARIQHVFCDFDDNSKRPINMENILMLKLVEKIGILERKIHRLEKNEEHMKDSLRALIATNAKMQLENSHFEDRMVNLETESSKNAEAASNLIKLFDFQNHGDEGVCLKPGISYCWGSHETENRVLKNGKRQSPALKVAFTAYLDHPIKTLGHDEAVIYNQVLLNDGNAYSSSTGIFTVPVSGVYLFSWASTARKLGNEHAYDVWIKLVVNGAMQTSSVAESRADTDDNQGSNTAIIRVREGDKVWTAHYSGYPDIYGDSNERSSSFTGTLLYEDP